MTIQKIACTCISAYTDRKLTDPDCCACNCSYNDVVDEIWQLREDNKALRDYVASLIGTLPKLKADAVREAVEYLNSHQSTSKTDYDLLNEYADKIERGE